MQNFKSSHRKFKIVSPSGKEDRLRLHFTSTKQTQKDHLKMADERRSNRKPVSLNDRRYRLLQDLSAPPKPPPSSSAAHGEEVKPSKVKLEGRSRLCKAVGGGTGDSGDVDDIHQFSGIGDFDSSPGYHDNENIDEISDVNNYQVTSHRKEMWRETIPTLASTLDATSQASHDEGNERRRCKRVLKNESLQSNKSARTDSTKRVERSAAMYERLENMIQLIQEKHNATMEMNTSMTKILNTMNIGASQSIGAGMDTNVMQIMQLLQIKQFLDNENDFWDLVACAVGYIVVYFVTTYTKNHDG
ncbi:hypothetical protein K2173_000950 [Erythroxylum novogranatense]|uniref:Uncharacterized protein n=1 Tax=Erythroxylum novogranatense TaxID=1862640 RepID=A0AAV8TSE8_9ROSI|nr:hypothetical protein K2173_000950 [Erythroxylum novogranatense]